MLFGTEKVRILIYWLLLFTCCNHSQCKNQNKVSLTHTSDGNRLYLVCHVENLSFGVTFYGPTGHMMGHCTAPIPQTAPGICDTTLMLQDIHNETTILTVDKKDKVNGPWKCSHGTNTNEYAITSVSLDPKKKSAKRTDLHEADSYDQNYRCTFLSLCFGHFVAEALQQLFILVCLKFRNDDENHRTTRTKLYYVLVVLPFGLIILSPLLLMCIPGICAGSWWIVVSFVGTIVICAIKVALAVMRPNGNGNVHLGLQEEKKLQTNSGT